MTTIVEHLLLHKGRHVHAVSPTSPIREAVDLLGKHQIGAILVCEDSRPVGLVTERMCMRNLLWQHNFALDKPVSELMETSFLSVAPSDTIQHCMALMNDRHTRRRHLVVVSQDQVVGIVSIGDVINGLMREQQILIEQLEGYVCGSPSVRPPASH
jgi:CBS domain-containing protein